MQEPGLAPAPVDKFVCFAIGDQEFGVAIEHVVETLELKPITRVFLTPAWVLGIINLRGDIVAVLDLGALLETKATTVGDRSRIVIVEHSGKSAGVVVDHLTELRKLDVGNLVPPSSTLAEDTRELIEGLATVDDGRALAILNLEALFASDRIRSLARE